MSDVVMLRLHYFSFPGRAGAIRDALRIGGITFDDVHVPPEEFAKKKAAGALPFGSLPVLEVVTKRGTIVVAQSNAILRYAGRCAGLYPADDPLRALKVDEALEVGEDLYHVFIPSLVEPDAARRAAMRKVMAEETIPRWGSYLDRLLVKNGTSDFVAGDTLTVADLKLHWVIDKLTNGSLDGIPKSVLDGFESLAKWRKSVAAVREARLAAAAS